MRATRFISVLTGSIALALTAAAAQTSPNQSMQARDQAVAMQGDQSTRTLRSGGADSKIAEPRRGETKTFLRTHDWDDPHLQWVLKRGDRATTR